MHVDLLMVFVPKFGTIWYRRIGMSKNTGISPGKHFDVFISQQIDDGRYASVAKLFELD